MNCFDFDQTIFKGNSMRRFFFFCLLRLPYLLLYLPVQIIAALLYAVRILNKDAFLRAAEGFVLFVPCKRRFVQSFWKHNFRRIKEWYLQIRASNDVVISASPQWLVRPACDLLEVTCIATDASPKTYLCGTHCYGAQKIAYFQRTFPQTQPKAFYSDSLSDEPMLRLAEKGYLVSGEQVTLAFEGGRRLV